MSSKFEINIFNKFFRVTLVIEVQKDNRVTPAMIIKVQKVARESKETKDHKDQREFVVYLSQIL